MPREKPPSWARNAIDAFRSAFPNITKVKVQVESDDVPGLRLSYETEVPVENGQAERQEAGSLPADEPGTEKSGKLLARRKIVEGMKKIVNPCPRKVIARAAGLSAIGGHFREAFVSLLREKVIIETDAALHLFWLTDRPISSGNTN